jgi:hypothetical protein
MSNFENWKAAKAEYELYERAYMAAREVVIEAGRKRGEAWEALVQAAYKLTGDEKKQAADYEFGPAQSPADREGK